MTLLIIDQQEND